MLNCHDFQVPTFLKNPDNPGAHCRGEKVRKYCRNTTKRLHKKGRCLKRTNDMNCCCCSCCTGGVSRLQLWWPSPRSTGRLFYPTFSPGNLQSCRLRFAQDPFSLEDVLIFRVQIREPVTGRCGDGGGKSMTLLRMLKLKHSTVRLEN